MFRRKSNSNQRLECGALKVFVVLIVATCTLLCFENAKTRKIDIDQMPDEEQTNDDQISSEYTKFPESDKKLCTDVLAPEIPIPGRVAEISVKSDQHVQKGDTLMVLDVMKMMVDIPATINGSVNEVFVNIGDLVDGAQLIASINDIEE
eukprot:167961_1